MALNVKVPPWGSWSIILCYMAVGCSASAVASGVKESSRSKGRTVTLDRVGS